MTRYLAGQELRVPVSDDVVRRHIRGTPRRIGSRLWGSEVAAHAWCKRMEREARKVLILDRVRYARGTR